MPVVMTKEELDKYWGSTSQRSWTFVQRDSDVFTDLGPIGLASETPGSVFVTSAANDVSVEDFGNPQDQVRVVARWPQVHRDLRPAGDDAIRWDVEAYVLTEGVWQKAVVLLVPVKREVYARGRGLIETDRIADKEVSVIGLGSMGQAIAVCLAQSGVVRQVHMDPDREQCANIMRDMARISDLGRFKVDVSAEVILGKNPYAHVEAVREAVTWANQDMLRRYIRQSDLVICTADGKDAKRIVNKVCVEECRTAIFAGAFRRGYGGQVHIFVPGGPCYECFTEAMPRMAQDREITTQEDADRLAYSDIPMVAEPGLVADIAPINTMVVKLALQQLLVGKESALHCLDEDLTAHFYLWLNRREPGTDYERLGPLQYNADGFRILRWYGIKFDRNEDCWCAGRRPCFDPRSGSIGYEVPSGGMELFPEEPNVY